MKQEKEEIDETFERLRRPTLRQMSALANSFIRKSTGLDNDAVDKRIKGWAANHKAEYDSEEEPHQHIKDFYASYGWTWRELRKASHDELNP